MFYCFICLSKSEVRDDGKRFVERQRAKRSMATLRWISLMNFCKLTVCDLSSSHCVQNLFRKTFKSSFDISSIGFENLMPPGVASHSDKVKIVVVVVVVT